MVRFVAIGASALLGVACSGAVRSDASATDSGGGGNEADAGVSGDGANSAYGDGANSGVADVGIYANVSGDGSVSEAGGGNLIVNPSCDDATLGWTTLSGTPLSSSVAFATMGDRYSCHASGRVDGYSENGHPQSSYDGPLQDVTSVVSAGHEYSFSVWALWAPPGDTSVPDAAATGDGALAEGGAAADAMVSSAGAPAQDGGGGTTDGPEEVYVMAKETCNAVTSYVTLVALSNVPEAQWTQVTSVGGGLMVPANCTQISIYIGGPDVGMDLYTDEATLLLVQ